MTHWTDVMKAWALYSSHKLEFIAIRNDDGRVFVYTSSRYQLQVMMPNRGFYDSVFGSLEELVDRTRTDVAVYWMQDEQTRN